MGRREARRAEHSARAGARGSRAAAAAVCVGLCVVAAALGTTSLRVALDGAPGSGSAGASSLVAATTDTTDTTGAATGSADRASRISAAVVPAPAAVALAAAPAPVALRVPSLGVSTALVRLGVTAEGTLEVPTDAAVAGWFDEGPAPGAVGPAVIAGHVDSQAGPGVFAHLRSVAVGAEVDVEREDGTTARFVVTAVRQVAKDAFPTQEVYGPVAGPELRLITCGGVFDEGTRHYVDNVVVFASEA